MASANGLLVKARSAPTQGALGVRAFSAEPLLPSIETQRAGLGAAASARWFHVTAHQPGISPWDACHQLLEPTLGAAAGFSGVEFAEPDITQRWLIEGDEAFAASKRPPGPAPQRGDYPHEPDDDWFRDATHGQFLNALAALPAAPSVVRVAHLDTGYDPQHLALPSLLRRDLGRSFVDGEENANAEDRSDGALAQVGHGTGTLGILAGRNPDNQAIAIGAAPFVEIVPLRVANSVVLFSNSAVAKALDHVHALCQDDRTRIDIVTMSMGGVASKAWADAVNALYDAGVFIVTAAGNNYGNLPTRNIVFPARFNRVVAACGVMANGEAYADRPAVQMAGNYGPRRKMRTAMSGYTPNLPWARFHSPHIVDHDGSGTSSATPQIAATAALWLAAHGKSLAGYDGWRRVEVIRAALFQSSEKHDEARCGVGLVRAHAALGKDPAPPSQLHAEDKDKADFAALRILTGLGVTEDELGPRQQMLELEALQLSQSAEMERIVDDPQDVPADKRSEVIAALAADDRASTALKMALGTRPQSAPIAEPLRVLPVQNTDIAREQLQRAKTPQVRPPTQRRLRVFAYDPSLGGEIETRDINETIIEIPWEPLQPGPIGEYLEVLDVDPASQACYAPVDLDNPYLLPDNGLAPSETNPQFHQQMAYAVASRTINVFERALGRAALWSPHFSKESGEPRERYVQRLRIYPHALRAANSYYSPDKKALLLGYFTGVDEDGQDGSSPRVFSALSHDIVAHETSHALLDGLHRRYREATNRDSLAFHEAFADIVALFQHFSLADSLRSQIARTRGDLSQESLLGQLAVQFGRGIGQRGALRDAIGTIEDGKWKPKKPDPRELDQTEEPHDRGAILVAAVFDAFLKIYRRRADDFIALATNGSGILPEGALPVILADRLAKEAAKVAEQVLNICIRALDYCPPIDVTFGDYLRALITADRDLVPDDPLGYRVAFTQAFRERGIRAQKVRAVSPDVLVWEPPPQPLRDLPSVLGKMNANANWKIGVSRLEAYNSSISNALLFHDWLVSPAVSDDEIAILGFTRHAGPMSFGDSTGVLAGIEVHSVRPLRRIGPNGESRGDLVIELTQGWRPDAAQAGVKVFRGGCTLIINREKQEVEYMVRKRIDHLGRFAAQRTYLQARAENTARRTYRDGEEAITEPFAALHRFGGT